MMSSFGDQLYLAVPTFEQLDNDTWDFGTMKGFGSRSYSWSLLFNNME